MALLQMVPGSSLHISGGRESVVVCIHSGSDFESRFQCGVSFSNFRSIRGHRLHSGFLFYSYSDSLREVVPMVDQFCISVDDSRKTSLEPDP